MFIIFFFQAEDGIRDGHVTGVQTCALPILLTTRERILMGHGSLPTTLHDAIGVLEESEFVADVLGETVFQSFLGTKRAVGDEDRGNVAPYGIRCSLLAETVGGHCSSRSWLRRGV